MTMVEQPLYHQCNGGTNTGPPLVMELETGSTNNHISQIFFVNYWAGVSGKGNRINPRWRPNKKRNGLDIYHHGPGPISIICQLHGPPLFLIGHYL